MEDFKEKLNDLDQNLLWYDSGNLLDDLVAIQAMFESEDFELAGISTTGTQSRSDAGYINGLAERLGWEIPVYYKDDAMESVEFLDEMSLSVIPEEEHSAVQAMIEYVKDREKMSFIINGPLTNLSDAIHQNESFLDNIGDVYFIGTTDNINADPAAFNHVIENIKIFVLEESVIESADITKTVREKKVEEKKGLEKLFGKLFEYKLYRDEHLAFGSLVALYAFVIKDGVIYEERHLKAGKEGLVLDDSVSSFYAVSLNGDHFHNFMQQLIQFKE